MLPNQITLQDIINLLQHKDTESIDIKMKKPSPPPPPVVKPKSITQVITVYDDGSTYTQDFKKVVTTSAIVQPELERTGRYVAHNDTQYTSISEAARSTKVNRYYIRQWCDNNVDGWSYV